LKSTFRKEKTMPSDDREFVESLLSGRFCHDSEFDEAGNVTDLDLRFFPSREDFERVCRLTHLKSLLLQSDEFTDVHLAKLPPTLVDLSLSSANFTSAGFKELERLTQLVQFAAFLVHPSLRTCSWEFLLRLKSLKEFSIGKGLLSNPFYEQLGQLRWLHELSVGDQTEMPTAPFETLDCEHQLHQLAFYRCSGLKGVSLEGLQRAQRVETIIFTSSDVKCAQLETLPLSLRALSISEDTDFDPENLAKVVEKLPEIRSIALYRTVTGDAEMSAICNALTLRRLDLRETKVTREGILRAVDKNPRLAVYALGHNMPFHHPNWTQEMLED
jgi:hypothetical protein